MRIAMALSRGGAGGGRWACAAQGAGAGVAGTAAMTGVLLAARAAGLLGELPPRRITDAALGAADVHGLSPAARRGLAIVAHFGFGAAMGAVFGALRPPGMRGAGRRAAAGAVFGLALYAASYAGWIPALGILPPPHRDVPGRPAATVAGHLVYGGVLGAIARGGA